MKGRCTLTPREQAVQIARIPERDDVPRPTWERHAGALVVTWRWSRRALVVRKEPCGAVTVELHEPGMPTDCRAVLRDPVRMVRGGIEWLMGPAPAPPGAEGGAP